jgi:NTE family protein
MGEQPVQAEWKNKMSGQVAISLHNGSYLDAVPHPCGSPLKPLDPSDPSEGPRIGLAMSGGGFRATFAALGVVRYLADVGLLGNVRYVSSVSGGSIANAALARHWPSLRAADFAAAAVDDLIIAPIADRVSRRSLKAYLVRNSWRAIGKKNRTDVLAWALGKWFLSDMTMDELDDEVRWIINGANLATGTRFTFEQNIVGDYVNGYAPMADARVPLALATAISAAVPGAFSAQTLPDLVLPCRGTDTVSLVDGGAYDNTGLEAIDSSSYDDVFTIALAAGGVFKIGAYSRLPLISDLTQANSSLYRQSRTLRTRDMVDRFIKNTRDGVLFKLGSTVREKDETPQSRLFAETYPEIADYDDEPLAFVGTSFDRFDRTLIDRLVYRGWWLTGKTMAAYHPALSPPPADLRPPPA